MCGTSVETVDREGTSPHPGLGSKPSSKQYKLEMYPTKVKNKGSERLGEPT
jgi:hypothetical protein